MPESPMMYSSTEKGFLVVFAVVVVVVVIVYKLRP